MGSHRRKIMRTSYTIEFLITHQFCSGSHDVQRDLKWGSAPASRFGTHVLIARSQSTRMTNIQLLHERRTEKSRRASQWIGIATLRLRSKSCSTSTPTVILVFRGMSSTNRIRALRFKSRCTYSTASIASTRITHVFWLQMKQASDRAISIDTAAKRGSIEAAMQLSETIDP